MTKTLLSRIGFQRISLLLALVGCLAAIPIPSRAVDLYVATIGNDAWSGHLTAPNGKRTDGPFATVERAFSNDSNEPGIPR